MEASDWLITTEVLRLRFGRVEFRPETGGELPRVKLGREGEPEMRIMSHMFSDLTTYLAEMSR